MNKQQAKGNRWRRVCLRLRLKGRVYG